MFILEKGNIIPPPITFVRYSNNLVLPIKQILVLPLSSIGSKVEMFFIYHMLSWHSQLHQF